MSKNYLYVKCNKHLVSSLIFFLSSIFLISPKVTAQSQKAIRVCNGIKSHVEERACLTKLAEKSNLGLKVAENDLLSKIALWNEDADYKTQTRVQFIRATKVFAKFLAEQCRFEASLAAGGNGAEDMRLACLIENSNKRIVEIRKLHEMLR